MSQPRIRTGRIAAYLPLALQTDQAAITEAIAGLLPPGHVVIGEPVTYLRTDLATGEQRLHAEVNIGRADP